MVSKGSVFHCNACRMRGLWWASPSLGRHSGRAQAEAGFLQRVGISKYLLYLYPNSTHGRLSGSCKCVFGVGVSLFGQIVF